MINDGSNEDGQLYIFMYGSWTAGLQEIESIYANCNGTTTVHFVRPFYDYQAGRFYFENLATETPPPGQFYYDKKSQMLYYTTVNDEQRDGILSGEVTVTIPQSTNLLQIEDRHDITFKNTIFR